MWSLFGGRWHTEVMERVGADEAVSGRVVSRM